MNRGTIQLVVVLAALAVAAGAAAQTPERRGAVFAIAGLGSFGDDEGSLGSGFVGGGGIGVRLSKRLRFEAAVTTTTHEQAESIAFAGRPTVGTGRLLLVFGEASSRTRPIIGAGIGYGHYAGTRTDRVFDAPTQPPRLETSAMTVNAVVTEVGGGAEIAVGGRAFVRPEAWLVMMGGEPSNGLEPPFIMPRVTVSGGMRF